MTSSPRPHPRKAYDFAVIGGGIVGCAIAYGLARKGASVIVLDGDDGDLRSSTGSFGLIWVQGKSDGGGAIARWRHHGAALWPTFAAELSDSTGVDLGWQCKGGLHVCLSDEELTARQALLERQVAHDPTFKYETLTAKDIADVAGMAPGPRVSGATFCPLDGCVDPLAVFRALRSWLTRNSVLRACVSVEDISRNGSGYCLTTLSDPIHAARVVIAAGLDTGRLAEPLGIPVPVRPVRGQILVTESIQETLRLPVAGLQQRHDGSIMIGESHEQCGLDDAQSMAVMSRLAARAGILFPALSRTRVVGGWAALRVMPRDGQPIYGESPTHPGVFAVACHGGLTMAAAHAGALADWISGAAPHPEDAFNSERFRTGPVSGASPVTGVQP